MLRCFECDTKAMFLIAVIYDDLYSHYDGKEAPRYICQSCFRRRLGIDQLEKCDVCRNSQSGSAAK